MTVNLTRKELITLAASVTHPPYGGDEYSEFCGNQWNENWRWLPNAFDRFTDEQLWNMYIDGSKQPVEQKIEEPTEEFSWPSSKTYPK